MSKVTQHNLAAKQEHKQFCTQKQRQVEDSTPKGERIEKLWGDVFCRKLTFYCYFYYILTIQHTSWYNVALIPMEKNPGINLKPFYW